MDFQEALDEYRNQPRTRRVWIQVEEPIPREPQTLLLTITPDVARGWLQCRVSPGWPDRGRAGKFADLMRQGKWHPREVEPIELKVSDVGLPCVMEGQHRLLAVTIADMPQALWVRFS
jgi:hypothetical protein